MNKKVKFSATLLASVFALAACGNGGSTESNSAASNEVANTEETSKYTIGVVGSAAHDVWDDVASRVEDEGIQLNIEEFSEYTTPNNALADGSLDLNAFQHLAFLADYVNANDADLQPIGYTFISPMGAYSNAVENIDDLADGASVVIPNDVTNGGRALQLLALAGLIELDDAAGISPTVSDITANVKNLNITEVDAAQVPRSLADADLVVSNTNYAVDAGLNPSDDAIFVDTDNLDDVGAQYKNAIVIRAEDAENEDFQKIVEAYQSEETATVMDEVTLGADKPAWSDNDDVAGEFANVLEQTN